MSFRQAGVAAGQQLLMLAVADAAAGGKRTECALEHRTDKHECENEGRLDQDRHYGRVDDEWHTAVCQRAIEALSKLLALISQVWANPSVKCGTSVLVKSRREQEVL